MVECMLGCWRKALWLFARRACSTHGMAWYCNVLVPDFVGIRLGAADGGRSSKTGILRRASAYFHVNTYLHVA